MPKKLFSFFLLTILCQGYAHAQQKNGPPGVDTSFTDYDLLFDELDALLDSIMAPGSFAMFNTGITSSYFNYESNNGSNKAKRKLIVAPSFSYFHKSGLGLTAATSIIREDGSINPYQSSATASYDFLGSKKFITGLSFTRFFTKENLPFYTSPLNSQAYAYFTYRNFWLKPSVALSYGWGSRTDFSQREEQITAIRLRPRGYTKINTEESVHDFGLTTSIRHDFYWLNLLSKKDFVRITPQISFVSGTQKFGFNQSSNTYATVRGTGTNVLLASENIYLDDALYFQPVSLTAFLKTEYSIGKFFVQPQLLFDYYFPATDKNFTTAFMVNAGVIF